MRKKLQIGTILAAALCAAIVIAIVLASRTWEQSPGPARSRAGAPSAPPSDPGILVDREFTEEEEEERVLKVARAYLGAWDEWEFETVWDLLSTPARNEWREILEAGKHGDKGKDWNFRDLARKYDAPRFDDPRDLFLSTAAQLVTTPTAHDRTQNRAADVVIEADLASVTWPDADLRMFLGREGGRWKVHLVAGPYGTFELSEAPGGRRVPSVWTVEISMQDGADRDRWWNLLPLLPGEGPDDPDREETLDGFTLFVDFDGRVRHFGKELTPEELERLLHLNAEWSRVMDDPAQPAAKWVSLFLDRNMPGEVFRKLLLNLTDVELRYRWLYLVARYDNSTNDQNWSPHGLAVDLDPIAYPTRVRIRLQETAVSLVLRDGEEAVFGVDLAETAAAWPAKTRQDGILLRCGPHVPVGRLLQVFHVLAQQEGLRVVLDLREETVPETRWGLELDGKPVRLTDPTGKVKTDFKLELWR